MTQALLLLAAFLMIVVVGAVLVALHDALEGALAVAGVEDRPMAVRRRVQRRPGATVGACRHLH